MSCLLISGQIASGKTVVAETIAFGRSVELVRVRDALRSILGVDGGDRLAMQREGAALDRRTNGRWLVEYLEERSESNEMLVVDAVRTRRQTLPILDRITDSRVVYLDAHESTRRDRYREAAETDKLKRSVPFEAAMRHPTETEVLNLRAVAHLVIETDDLEPIVVANLAIEAFPSGK